MKIKKISKILTFGILLNSIPINSFASILSEDTRYETFEGNNITIPNILEEDKIDVEIEGNTLVNLLNEKHLSYISNDRYSFNNPDNNNIPNKEGKTYSLINKTGVDIIMIIGNLEEKSYKKTIHTNGENCTVYTLEENEYIRYIQLLSEKSDVQYNNIKLTMLLEGDWSNKEVPEYFEGMKSVGQDDENGHKIEIVSQNKNLFDINTWADLINCTVDTIAQTVTIVGASNDSYTPSGANGGSTCPEIQKKYLIKVKPNTTYTLSMQVEGTTRRVNYIQQYDKDYNNLGVTSYGTDTSDKKTFTTKSNCKYIGFRVGVLGAGNTLVYSNIQLEENSTNTTYISNSHDKKENLLDEPLGGLSNGVNDKVVKINGQQYIEKNCKEVVFDGSGDEAWEKYVSYGHGDDGNTHLFRLRLNDSIYGVNSILYCDRMYADYGNKYDYNKEMIYLYNEYIYVHVFASNLSTINVSGFKQYLQQNPTTVMYQLATPIYKPVKMDLTVQLFEGTTYISNNSTIPANLKVIVDRVANRAKEYSKLAKENPTIENISLARMWTNKMRESILKDEFQDSIDGIARIVDLQLERKTSSANIDMYIKCENMLSMSLDTNSVAFEDFSSIEDIIKENAVNISINSSLPYQLNAYLPVEIQNSDKSVTMDKRILNIKENSESNYQTFANTTDKIVLKDNCSNGNDLVHNIDIKLKSGIAHQKDVYKTTIKFEAEQK